MTAYELIKDLMDMVLNDLIDASLTKYTLKEMGRFI